MKQEPGKVEILFWSISRAIFLFKEGPFAGQTILWYGEWLGTGNFWFYPMRAAQIRPVSDEQVRYAIPDGIEVIRELNKDEYPTLIQELEENCDYKKRWKALEF